MLSKYHVSASLINSIMRHPDIYVMSTETPEIDPNNYDFGHLYLEDDRVHFWLMGKGRFEGLTPKMEEGTGYILYRQRGWHIYSIHCGFIKGYRGRMALRAVELLNLVMFCKFEAKVITAEIPDHNTPAKRLAIACGFQRVGRYTDGWTVAGKSHDLILYEALPCLA